jgi:hypothetical protein
MKLNPQDLEKITDLTLDHYNEHAEDFWEGTRDHNVNQNIAALLQCIEGEPPFTILDFGCGPGRDLKVFAERVHIPPDLAAEMVPIDPMMGEFRVHYAGFFDPGFGYTKEGHPGARAVLEVRSHEVPFVLEHGQPVGRLDYERLAEQPDILYGQTNTSNYQGQGLKLSKHFKS